MCYGFLRIPPIACPEYNFVIVCSINTKLGMHVPCNKRQCRVKNHNVMLGSVVSYIFLSHCHVHEMLPLYFELFSYCLPEDSNKRSSGDTSDSQNSSF